METYKYMVFNYTKRKFENLICGKELQIGSFVTLPQGELQIFKLVGVF